MSVVEQNIYAMGTTGRRDAVRTVAGHSNRHRPIRPSARLTAQSGLGDILRRPREAGPTWASGVSRAWGRWRQSAIRSDARPGCGIICAMKQPALILGSLLATSVALAGCSSGSGSASSLEPQRQAEPRLRLAGASEITGVTCKPVTGSPKTMQFPAAGNAGADGLLTLTTNCGDIVIKTLPAKSPRPSISRPSSRSRGTDFTTCHRLTTEGLFVLQCGDPTGTGRGPGYQYANEYVPGTPPTITPAGTVAMANAGPEHQWLAVLHRVREHDAAA